MPATKTALNALVEQIVFACESAANDPQITRGILIGAYHISPDVESVMQTYLRTLEDECNIAPKSA